MTSKFSEGDRIAHKVDKIFDSGSNGNRYSRSYKAKSMERGTNEKKQARTKSRVVRLDDVASNPVTGPIKIREKVRLMNDNINEEELTKNPLSKVKAKIPETTKDDVFIGPVKVKDKGKALDTSKDDTDILTSSTKVREKGRSVVESLKDESVIASPLKLREKVKSSDNLKEESFPPVSSPRGREKTKSVEFGRVEQGPLSGTSPIKLREKMKTADNLKEDSLSSPCTFSKGQEKSKLSADDLPSYGTQCPIKLREKLKTVESVKDDSGGSPASLPKEHEKFKLNLQPFKEESGGNRISPFKLREKVKIADNSKEDSGGSCNAAPKVREKAKSNNDSVKDQLGYSPSAVKLKERGRMTEKQDETHFSSTSSAAKSREKEKVVLDANDDLSSAISVKMKDKTKVFSEEFKNGEDIFCGKKELGSPSLQLREHMEDENDGAPMTTRREGKTGSTGKIRKVRSLISPIYSSKKPVSDSKMSSSRNDEKSEVSTSDRVDINVNLRYGEIGLATRTGEEEIMNSDVSSSQDQRGCIKILPIKFSQNRSASRIIEDSEWHPGDLAWGRIGQHPFWPCMVTVDVDSGQFKKTKKIGRGFGTQSLHVQFFGDKGRHSWIPFKNALRYEGKAKLLAFSEGILAQTKKRDKKFISSFVVKPSSKSRWDTAIEEADNAVSLSREQRKIYFEDLLLNKPSAKKSDGYSKEENSVTLSTDKKKRRHSFSYEKHSKKFKANVTTDLEKKIQKRTPRKKQGRKK